MGHNESIAELSLTPHVERVALSNPLSSSLFRLWCEANDNISVEQINREVWNSEPKKKYFQRKEDGSAELFIPHDLQPWEMIGVMSAIDNDTFLRLPERALQSQEKMKKLGELFQNAGIYIAKRLPAINEGSAMAMSLAKEFFSYGNALLSGYKDLLDVSIDEIAEQDLSPEETKQVDEFLAGRDMLRMRTEKVENQISKIDIAKDESLSETGHFQRDLLFENVRQIALSQFFRVTEKAYILRQKSHQKPVNDSKNNLTKKHMPSSIHEVFISDLESALQSQVEKPQEALQHAIFRRGMYKLLTEVKVGGLKSYANEVFRLLHLDWKLEQQKLIDAVDATRLKAELAEVRKTGDSQAIGNKEREIASRIQKYISRFPYSYKSSEPSRILQSQFINCVGASMLGGELMQEIGLKYAVGTVPRHSITLLATEDNKLYWYDMLSEKSILNPRSFFIDGKEIKEQDLFVGVGEQSLKTQDIIQFIRQEKESDEFFFKIPERLYKKSLGKKPWAVIDLFFLGIATITNNSSLKKSLAYPFEFISLSHHQHGQEMQLLNNMGTFLLMDKPSQESKQQSLELFRLGSKNIWSHKNYAALLYELDEPNKGIQVLQEMLSDNQKDASIYNLLGAFFYQIGDHENASHAFRQAVLMKPTTGFLHDNLAEALDSFGKKDDAKREYAIALGLYLYQLMDIAVNVLSPSSLLALLVSNDVGNILKRVKEIGKKLSNEDIAQIYSQMTLSVLKDVNVFQKSLINGLVDFLLEKSNSISQKFLK